jgi:hypothetical protein
MITTRKITWIKSRVTKKQRRNLQKWLSNSSINLIIVRFIGTSEVKKWPIRTPVCNQSGARMEFG